MDIQYAILGLLCWQPLSGYDLKKIIAESDLFYWSGNNNQIYNNLVQMHKNGMVTQEIQYQENLPARKVYSITPEGQGELTRQALSEPELPEIHRHFLIQLAWTDHLTTEQIDKLLAKYEEEIAVQFRMRQISPNLTQAGPNRTRRESYLWRQIAEKILADYERELEWIRRVRADLACENFQSNQEETLP